MKSFRQYVESSVPGWKKRDSVEGRAKRGYNEARRVGHRIPDLESEIMLSPRYGYYYAQYVIKGRWPEFEDVVVRVPAYSSSYAAYVLRKRWPEAEAFIKETRDMEAAIHYAKMVIKGRWPEVERILLSGDFDYMCYLYAKDVIKGRWIEAEPVIMKNIYQNNLYIHGLFFLGYKDFESVLRDPSVSEFFAGPSPLESGPLESCWDSYRDL